MFSIYVSCINPSKLETFKRTKGVRVMFQSIQMNSKFMLRAFRAARSRNLGTLNVEEISAVVENKSCCLCYHREKDATEVPCTSCVCSYEHTFFTPITAPVVIIKEEN